MDENRFFRFLGRVNAVLVTLTALVVLAFLLSTFVGSAPFYAPPQGAVVHGKAPDKDYSYEFAGVDFGDEPSTSGGGTVTIPEGWREAMMVLKRVHATRSGPISSGGGVSSEAVNVLLIDLGTAQTHWMFAGVNRFIGSTIVVRAAKPAPPGNESNPVVALLMPIADADSNGDGKIDEEDDQSLYLYRPSEGARKLLAAKAISNIVQIDSGRVMVTYYDGKTDRVVFFATADFKPLVENTIAATPQ